MSWLNALLLFSPPYINPPPQRVEENFLEKLFYPVFLISIYVIRNSIYFLLLYSIIVEIINRSD